MIILFGVVGSGKSEQAKRIVEKFQCPYVSTSRLIREKSNPEWENMVASGILLPDGAVLPLIDHVFETIDAAHREFVLDGAPRSIGQAEWLVQKIKNGQVKLTAFIHLQVSKETTMERLLMRDREDDKVDIIAERFNQYETITTPVLEFLRKSGYKVYEVDGEWSADIVERQIWKVLEEEVETQDR